MAQVVKPDVPQASKSSEPGESDGNPPVELLRCRVVSKAVQAGLPADTDHPPARMKVPVT